MRSFKSRIKRVSIYFRLIVGTVLLSVTALASAVVTVISTADTGAGSLRAALAGAVAGETINFALPSFSTIVLASELPITKSVTIQGPGPQFLTITDSAGRIFHLDNSAKTVLMAGLSLSGATVTGNGGAILNDGGNLTIQFCTISGNTATGGTGGAIFNSFNGSGNQLTIQNTTISGNNSQKSAAIDFIGFQLIVENSTIANNTAVDSAGAIGFSFGTGSIRNSTIVGNRANFVGGINSQSSTLTFESTILANNTDISGINDLNRTGGGASFVNATNSLFSEAFVPADNVINGTNTMNLVGTDPQLGTLTNNGGPTLTLRPLATSPAIGAGVNLQGYVNDQRGPGFPRSIGVNGLPGLTDIGAIQFFILVAAPPALIPSLSPLALMLTALLLIVAAGCVRRRTAVTRH